MFKRLLIIAVCMTSGCAATSGSTLGLAHSPSVLSSPGPAPSGLKLTSYPNTLNCDPSKNQTTVTYYPGQKDFFGNIVADGSEEVFSFIYDAVTCATD